MARPKVVHIKSNTLNKKPTTGQIDYGEIAVNYNSGNTFLAVKDSKNDIKVFTDKTTNDASYAPKDDVTTSTHGLMTAADKTKLDGIASGATKYSHPTFTAETSGFYKIAVNNEGHVTGTTNVAKSDITGLIGGTPSLEGHTHDDRYYTETEVNTKLETINGKMVTGATMSSTATTPSVDNNVLTIPTVAGKPGTDAGFGTPTASIDSNTGEPTVIVTASGPDTAKVFDFEFKNLKGKDGTNGSDGRDGKSASITGATATATTLGAGENATAEVSLTGGNLSRGFNFTFGIPKGEKGDTGAQGPDGPSANATTNNGKRYLMGLSSTTGNITGATTSGSCYMSGGCLYSENQKVALSSEIPTTYAGSSSAGGPANSALAVRDYASTGDTIVIGYAGLSLTAREITHIAAYNNGNAIKNAKAEAVISFLSAVTQTELDNKGYLTAVTVSNHYSPSTRAYFLHERVNGEGVRTPLTDISVDSKGHIVGGYCTSKEVAFLSDLSSYVTSEELDGKGYVYRTGDTMSGTLHINSTSTALTCTGKTEFKGDVTVTGKVSASSGFFQTSDRRLKNFQGDIEVDFDKLKSIPKKYFYWNMDSKKSKLEIGTSAQEVMEVYPELVSINEAGMLSVAYDKLSVIALKAVDELHEENVALKEKNDELERRLKAIEEKLGI